MLDRKLRRRFDIQEQACRLVIERGYQGFTMDDLAEAVGVSRRTLFNDVSDKAGAVLGPEIELSGVEAVTTFRDGGPSGELLPDLVATIDSLTALKETTDADLKRHRLVEQAMAADPKVHQLITERFAEMTGKLAAFICAREGWSAADLRARALAASMFALIKLAIDEHAARHAEIPFGDLFAEVLAAESAARAIHRRR